MNRNVKFYLGECGAFTVGAILGMLVSMPWLAAVLGAVAVLAGACACLSYHRLSRSNATPGALMLLLKMYPRNGYVRDDLHLAAGAILAALLVMAGFASEPEGRFAFAVGIVFFGGGAVALIRDAISSARGQYDDVPGGEALQDATTSQLGPDLNH
jgi:hypothetical protein